MLEKYTISRKDNTDLNVYRCGYEECAPGYMWGPAVRDHYIIHYVLSGEGIFMTNGNACSIKAGEGFLICPDHIVSYKADSKRPWTYSWVGFHGLRAESILKKAGLSIGSPVFEYQESSRLQKSLHDLIMAARHESASDLMLTGYLFVFLSLLVGNHEQTQAPGSSYSLKDRYVSRAVDYIAKNYGTTLTVTDLAKFLQLDRSYLYTLFTKYVGMSPQSFLIRFRMEKAAELLKNQLLDIGDVARSVGYDDPLQFSKTFKKAKGLSPTAFRKHNQ